MKQRERQREKLRESNAYKKRNGKVKKLGKLSLTFSVLSGVFLSFFLSSFYFKAPHLPFFSLFFNCLLTLYSFFSSFFTPSFIPSFFSTGIFFLLYFLPVLFSSQIFLFVFFHLHGCLIFFFFFYLSFILLPSSLIFFLSWEVERQRWKKETDELLW